MSAGVQGTTINMTSRSYRSYKTFRGLSREWGRYLRVNPQAISKSFNTQCYANSYISTYENIKVTLRERLSHMCLKWKYSSLVSSVQLVESIFMTSCRIFSFAFQQIARIHIFFRWNWIGLKALWCNWFAEGIILIREIILDNHIKWNIVNCVYFGGIKMLTIDRNCLFLEDASSRSTFIE